MGHDQQQVEYSCQSQYPVDVERDSALFLMRVANKLSLCHSSVNQLCSSTQSFLESITESLSAKIQRTLQESGIEDETILGNVVNTCQSNDVFSHVSSRYQRETYYEKNFHGLVCNNTIVTLNQIIILVSNVETRTYLSWK